MHNQPNISVIITCYNCENFVSRAIDSVLNQTLSPLEIILVNNNSTDNTVDVLKKYQLLYPNNIRIVNETKQGAPAARNKGLYEAMGDWIQFLDADDELMPEKLESQYSIAEKSNSALVVSPYTMKGFRNNKLFMVTRSLEYPDFWLGLIRSRLGITSANLWKREYLLAVSGWDEILISSQEYDLMFRILQIHPVVAFDYKNLTIIHILSSESVSRGGGKMKGLQILKSRIGLRLRIKEYLLSEDLLTKPRAYYLDRFIYKQLYLHYRFYPETVTSMLMKINLSIKIFDRVVGNYFIFKMNLKKLLKLGKI